MQKGTLLVEILVAAMVLGTILIVTATALGIALDASVSGKEQNDATFLLQEELEPLLTIRDKGWVANMVNGTYYVAPSGSSWTLVPTVAGETVGQFTRKVVISDVYRDTNRQITSTGGTLDPSTKKAAATVSWQGFLPHTLSATTYITRYKDNLTWMQTTEAEFNAGTKSGVAVVNNSGGEVILGAGGGGDWCDPNLSITALDLPKQGVTNAVTAIDGRAFAGTGDNASGESFVNINITNTNPPVASILGTFSNYKTNDVFGETNYAYIATDTNAKEVVIIDISSIPFTEVGYFNASGSDNGDSIFISGSVGYLVQEEKLWSFDLSSKTGSRPVLDPDGLTLRGDGTSVFVVGSHAYVSLEDSPKEMQIVDVSDPRNLRVVGEIDVDPANLNSGDVARDVFVNGGGTRAYLVIERTSALAEVFIVDVTNKAIPTIVGSYDTGAMSPRAVEAVTGGKVIVVGSGGEEYQVVDISNEASPVRCGGLEINTSVFDSASVLESDNDAYAYIVTGDSNSEFKIIEGGPGGAFATSGTFESSTFDPGFQTAFNRFDVTHNKPTGTDITFQIAVVDAGGDGTCSSATFTFVGPDGTPGSFFTDDDVIPLSDDGTGFENPGRCFRYRAYLTRSGLSATPTLYDFTVNYSP